MKNIFKILYTTGLIAAAGVFLFLEWQSLHEDLSKIINPLVHLGVLLAMFLNPFFWGAALLIFAGHMGELLAGKKG